MSFFLYGSWDVCLQSAGSVHPFRTRIFPSSCESSRLCRKANPPEIFVPAPCGAGTRHLMQAQCKPVTSPASIPPASTAPLCRATGAAMVWGWETLRVAPCHGHTQGADAPGLALDHVHHRSGQLLPSPLAATAGFGT